MQAWGSAHRQCCLACREMMKLLCQQQRLQVIMKSFGLVVMMPAHPPPSCHFCWCLIIWVFNRCVVPLGFCFRRAHISTQA
jgi:hypothetical protein